MVIPRSRSHNELSLKNLITISNNRNPFEDEEEEAIVNENPDLPAQVTNDDILSINFAAPINPFPNGNFPDGNPFDEVDSKENKFVADMRPNVPVETLPDDHIRIGGFLASAPSSVRDSESGQPPTPIILPNSHIPTQPNTLPLGPKSPNSPQCSPKSSAWTTQALKNNKMPLPKMPLPKRRKSLPDVAISIGRLLSGSSLGEDDHIRMDGLLQGDSGTIAATPSVSLPPVPVDTTPVLEPEPMKKFKPKFRDRLSGQKLRNRLSGLVRVQLPRRRKRESIVEGARSEDPAEVEHSRSGLSSAIDALFKRRPKATTQAGAEIEHSDSDSIMRSPFFDGKCTAESSTSGAWTPSGDQPLLDLLPRTPSGTFLTFETECLTTSYEETRCEPPSPSVSCMFCCSSY